MYFWERPPLLFGEAPKRGLGSEGSRRKIRRRNAVHWAMACGPPTCRKKDDGSVEVTAQGKNAKLVLSPNGRYVHCVIAAEVKDYKQLVQRHFSIQKPWDDGTGLDSQQDVYCEPIEQIFFHASVPEWFHLPLRLAKRCWENEEEDENDVDSESQTPLASSSDIEYRTYYLPETTYEDLKPDWQSVGEDGDGMLIASDLIHLCQQFSSNDPEADPYATFLNRDLILAVEWTPDATYRPFIADDRKTVSVEVHSIVFKKKE